MLRWSRQTPVHAAGGCTAVSFELCLLPKIFIMNSWFPAFTFITGIFSRFSLAVTCISSEGTRYAPAIKFISDDASLRVWHYDVHESEDPIWKCLLVISKDGLERRWIMNQTHSRYIGFRHTPASRWFTCLHPINQIFSYVQGLKTGNNWLVYALDTPVAYYFRHKP